MLLSLNWLKDYFQKADVKINPKELADQLTMRGLPVAMIHRKGSILDNVIVGRIEQIEKHPKADRLQITQISTSEEEGAPLRQIVCGAKNIAVGDLVPVAMPGCVLSPEITIRVSTIRGVESSGMLCSGKELGISEDTDGILQLPKHSKRGEPITRLLGGSSDDVVLEFELTPNRGDCLGVMGLAREIAPLLGTRLREPKPARFRVSNHRTSSIIKLEVEDPVLCPRYVARVIDTIKVTESPDWIKARLEIVGIRPINNVVDITNFVMMEYGQPLHAFDLRKLQSGGVRVAACKQAQPFTLLNGDTVQLEPGDILIMDGEKPIALAGIMGGANSLVQEDTTSILLESAGFLSGQIRKTARRLGLFTDSSKRFEKGHDLAAIANASERAAALLRDSFNANVYHPPIDTNEYGVKEAILPIDMRDVRKTLGIKSLKAEGIAELLEQVDIPSHKRSVNILSVRLPSFRPDLKDSVDIIEEVARLQGYEKIPSTLPHSKATYSRLDEDELEYRARIKDICVGLGLRETIHYSFTSRQSLENFGFFGENSIELKNPISDEMRWLRPSLIPSLLSTYVYNLNRNSTNQQLFEVANTYLKSAKGQTGGETGIEEHVVLSVLLSGNQFSQNWKKSEAPVDFFTAKGILQSVFKALGNPEVRYEPHTHQRLFHPHRSATLYLGGTEIGYIGEVHPSIAKSTLETEESVVVFEVALAPLQKLAQKRQNYKSPSKFPSSDYDIALLVDKPVPAETLVQSMRAQTGELLSDVRVFDLYEGDNLPSGKKSLAFRLTFNSPQRTLQDPEIKELVNKVVHELSMKFGAQLR